MIAEDVVKEIISSYGTYCPRCSELCPYEHVLSNRNLMVLKNPNYNRSMLWFLFKNDTLIA